MHADKSIYSAEYGCLSVAMDLPHTAMAYREEDYREGEAWAAMHWCAQFAGIEEADLSARIKVGRVWPAAAAWWCLLWLEC